MGRKIKIMDWFCLYDNFFNDPKIEELVDIPGIGIDKAERLFIRLLCLANKIDFGGYIHVSVGVPMSIHRIAKACDTDTESMEKYIKEAVRVGLLIRDEDSTFYINGWEKAQSGNRGIEKRNHDRIAKAERQAEKKAESAAAGDSSRAGSGGENGPEKQKVWPIRGLPATQIEVTAFDKETGKKIRMATLNNRGITSMYQVYEAATDGLAEGTFETEEHYHDYMNAPVNNPWNGIEAADYDAPVAPTEPELVEDTEHDGGSINPDEIPLPNDEDAPLIDMVELDEDSREWEDMTFDFGDSGITAMNSLVPASIEPQTKKQPPFPISSHGKKGRFAQAIQNSGNA